MGKYFEFSPIGATFLLVALAFPLLVQAKNCKFGENGLIDQLVTCTQAKLHDLDLTPQGDYVKSTARALVDQGLSNRTTIVYAKLGGLWTVRRTDLADTNWRCDTNKTSATAVVEFNGLSMEVIEKVDIPLHRSQSKLAIHKPCKTFDLPLWMCRLSKPIFRTTKTWVNRAYFNLTLTQNSSQNKPTIQNLNSLFTCPETFKQKITYSPSAMYILSKYVHSDGRHQSAESSSSRSLREKRNNRSEPSKQANVGSSVVHPALFTHTQDGKGPATPPYHNSVNLIMNQVSESLRSAINDCTHLLDSDLFLVGDNNSILHEKTSSSDGEVKREDNSVQEGINECSNKHWLLNRLDLANQAASLKSAEQQQDENQHYKRSQFRLKYPVDPNQLLNPYGYYHENSNKMIEDS